MARTIRNPAAFNSGDGLSVRASFFFEGYGLGPPPNDGNANGASGSFKAYRRGGPIVPDTAAFSGVGLGTEGSPLRLSQFSGLFVPSFEIVNISNHLVYVQRQAFNDGQSSALARLSLSSSGVLSLLGSTAYNASFSALGEINIDGSDYFDDTEAGSAKTITVANEWLQSGTPSLYSARVTIVSGATPNGSTRVRTGTFGSFLPLTSTLEWTLSAFSTTSSRDNIMNNVLTLDIALTSDTSTIIDTATIELITRAQTASGDIP
jgi:hypothetical protein